MKFISSIISRIIFGFWPLFFIVVVIILGVGYLIINNDAKSYNYAANNSLNESAVETSEVQTPTTSIESGIEIPTVYSLIGGRYDPITKKFEERIGADFSKDGIAADIIVEYENLIASYVQGDYKFVFSTTSAKYGGDYDDVVTIYKNNKEIKKFIDWRIDGLTKIIHNGINYYSLETFSGGAHCCFTDHPMVMRGGNLIFGDEVFFGHAGGLQKDSLFTKNGKLYFYAYNNSFSYFHTCFANSGIMWYPSFYVFDAKTGNYQEVNAEFRPYYLQIAEDIKKVLKQMDDEYHDTLTAQDRLPFLVSITTHRLLGGEKISLVKKDFFAEYSVNKVIYIDDKETEELPNDPNIIWNEILRKLGINEVAEKSSYNTSSSLTYDQAIGLGQKAVGKEVVWTGEVAHELSQISGIKFWIVDGSHPANGKRQGYEWFWALDEDTMYLPLAADGQWVTYLMAKFVGDYDCDDCRYEVRGRIYSLDCDFYSVADFGKEICIPNVFIESMKRVPSNI